MHHLRVTCCAAHAQTSHASSTFHPTTGIMPITKEEVTPPLALSVMLLSNATRVAAGSCCTFCRRRSCSSASAADALPGLSFSTWICTSWTSETLSDWCPLDSSGHSGVRRSSGVGSTTLLLPFSAFPCAFGGGGSGGSSGAPCVPSAAVAVCTTVPLGVSFAFDARSSSTTPLTAICSSPTI